MDIHHRRYYIFISCNRRDGTIYIGSNDKKLYALTSTGKLKWKYGPVDGGGPGSPVIGSDGTLYFGVSAFDFNLYAIQDRLTASATPLGGYYNTSKTVSLKMNKPGNIYYTTNGTTPTTSSPKYTAPILINVTTVLKYMSVDLTNNKSPIYTQTYIIDKVAPTANATPLGGIS